MTAQAEAPHAALPPGATRVHNSAVHCCVGCAMLTGSRLPMSIMRVSLGGARRRNQ
jgi:hypothetical protein